MEFIVIDMNRFFSKPHRFLALDNKTDRVPVQDAPALVSARYATIVMNDNIVIRALCRGEEVVREIVNLHVVLVIAGCNANNSNAGEHNNAKDKDSESMASILPAIGINTFTIRQRFLEIVELPSDKNSK